MYESYNLQLILEKFWSVENCSTSIPFTHDEIECETLYSRSTYRDAWSFCYFFTIQGITIFTC